MLGLTQTGRATIEALPGATPFPIAVYRSSSSHGWRNGTGTKGSAVIRDPNSSADTDSNPSGWMIFSAEIPITIPAGGGDSIFDLFHVAAGSSVTNNSLETKAVGFPPVACL